MFKSHTPLSAKGAIVVLSALMFFFSAQVSLTIYIDSSYVKETIEHTPSLAAMQIWDDPEQMVGTLYTFASLITLLALIYAPLILRKFGNYRWTLAILVLHILLLLGLGLSGSAWLIIPLFIVEAALISLLYFNLDVFLERYSTDAETGEIRGLFLVIGSIAWMLPPFFSGVIIDNWGFQLVYLTGAALMIPTIFIMMRYFSDFQDLTYDDVPILMSKVDSAKHPDIGRILWTNFFLHFFYAWMIIYAPLYFHNHLDVSYEDFGLILTLALSAFVIFPYPAGWLADKWIGEKELLVGGFVLMAIATALIPTLASAGVGIAMWAILLFIGRAGASTVEAMAEAYFFKQIDGRNAGLMGYFRRSRPMAFIAAPILASLLMGFNIVAIEGLFYILAVIMLLAIYFPLRLKDTL
ncbi:MAG: MFS transporter [bacterium]|nr:MFS transporter [bacterium]